MAPLASPRQGVIIGVRLIRVHGHRVVVARHRRAHHGLLTRRGAHLAVAGVARDHVRRGGVLGDVEDCRLGLGTRAKAQGAGSGDVLAAADLIRGHGPVALGGARPGRGRRIVVVVVVVVVILHRRDGLKGEDRACEQREGPAADVHGRNAGDSRSAGKGRRL